MTAKRLIFVAGALACAASLGGCVVGPRYQPPSTPPQAAGAFVGAGPAAASLQPPPADWWRLYQAPALDRLVQQALTENKDLEVAAANLEQARAILQEARAGRFPSTDVTASASYGRSQTAIANAGDKVVSPSPYYTAGFDVSYELDLFGRIRRTIEAARANTEAAAAAEDVARVSVAGETTRAYLDACAFAEQTAVARRSLAIVSQTYDVTVRERAAGAASDFDVARAAAVVEQTRAAIPSLDGQRRAALFQLAVLTGRPPAEISPEADACTAPPRLTTPLPVGDGAALLRRRPDVREAERRVAAATAQIGIATADLYPTITLGGSVGTAGSTLGRFASARSISFGLGPLLSWTFPNQSVARARIAQARAGASAALAGFDSTVLQALNETEQALVAYDAELTRHVALTAARDQSARAFGLAQVQYRAGSASFLDLLTAERDLVSADQALAASDAALVNDQITVFKALGGGWEQAPAVTPPAVPDGRPKRAQSAP